MESVIKYHARDKNVWIGEKKYLRDNQKKISRRYFLILKRKIYLLNYNLASFGR